MLPSAVIAINVAGLVLFATLLWRSRARIAGLAAFATPLVMRGIGLVLPEPVPSDSWYMAIILWLAYAGLVGDVLLLGVVYSLRNPLTPRAESTEDTLARLLGLGFLGIVAYAAVLGRPYGWGHAASCLVWVMAIVAVLARFGLTGLAFGFVISFVLLLGADGLDAFIYFSGERDLLPRGVSKWISVAGLLGLVVSLALVSRSQLLERTAWPGDNLRWEWGRWKSLAFVLIGSIVLAVLGHAVHDVRLFGAGGFRGRGAVVVFIIPALLMYLCLVGAFGIVRGTPRFNRTFLK